MPLKFECNQDPRKMKTVKGAKFCELCQKNVYDMRRKSVDKIVALKKELGECCVLIYEDQLAQAEQILNSENNKATGNKKAASMLPYAAGLAALSFLPQLTPAQTILSPQSVQIKKNANEDGTSEKNLKKIPSSAKTKNEYNGLITSAPKKASKKQKLNLGFYDEENTFVIVKTIQTRSDGSFGFSLTAAEKEAFNNKTPAFQSSKYSVYAEAIAFDKPEEAILINVRSKRVLVRGGF